MQDHVGRDKITTTVYTTGLPVEPDTPDTYVRRAMVKALDIFDPEHFHQIIQLLKWVRSASVNASYYDGRQHYDEEFTWAVEQLAAHPAAATIEPWVTALKELL